MNIQIFGIKKCNDTRKAERFFKERKIKYDYRNLAEKGISRGELENFKRKIDIDDLIDTKGKQYRRRQLEYMDFDKDEELLADPLLLKTPIVRSGNNVTIGYKPDIWKVWIE